MSTEKIEVSLELLKECGTSIRESWDLITNILRNFLYLNLILFTVFAFSLDKNPLETRQATAPSSQSANATATQTGPVALLSSAESSDVNFKFRRVLSFFICVIGIVGSVAAGLILYRMSDHGRRFLAAADKLEKYILKSCDMMREADLAGNPYEVEFYISLYNEEMERKTKKNYDVDGGILFPPYPVKAGRAAPLS